MNAASVQPARAISFGPPAQGSFANHFASKEASGLDIINTLDADNFKMIAETPRKRSIPAENWKVIDATFLAMAITLGDAQAFSCPRPARPARQSLGKRLQRGAPSNLSSHRARSVADAGGRPHSDGKKI
jgi:hypothetical protein